MIRVLETLDDWNAYRGAWEALERSAPCSPFQTFAWNLSAWEEVLSKRPKVRPFILVAEEADATPRIIVPCYLERGILRFMLGEHADHGDALYARDVPLGRFWTELCMALRERWRQVRGMDLRRVPAESALLSALALAFPEAVLSKMGGYGVLDVEGTGGVLDAMRHLPSLKRKTLRRTLERTEALTYRHFARRASGEPFPEEAIRRLRDTMIRQGVRRRDFLPDALVALARKLYEADACEVVGLFEGEEPCVLNVILTRPGYDLLWIIVFNNRNLPTALNCRYLDEVCRSGGARRIDFGTGAYAYKFTAFSPEPKISFRVTWRRGKLGTLSLGGLAVARWVRDVLKSPRGWWA